MLPVPALLLSRGGMAREQGKRLLCHPLPLPGGVKAVWWLPWKAAARTVLKAGLKSLFFRPSIALFSKFNTFALHESTDFFCSIFCSDIYLRWQRERF